MKLAYQLWRSQSVEQAKLILLHGMGGTGALWRPLAVDLDHFSLLAPDQRGHGRSQLPQEQKEGTSYSPLAYGQDVVETLEELKFYPSWVLGHSMGVRTACALAHLKPEWVQGLILIDLGFEGPAGGGLGKNLECFLQKLPQRFGSRPEAKAFMLQECPDPSIAQYLIAVSVTDQNGLTFPFDQQALVKTIQAARGFSLRKWIQEYVQRGNPILALRGALSQVWSQEEFQQEQEYFKKYPSLQFEEIPDTGHGLPFEKRKLLIARIRTLLLTTSTHHS